MASTKVAPEKTREDILIEEQGFDDHFHEHHHGDKYQSNFITKYVFSMDHKIIAKQFLITGMFWALIGAGMSIIFRLQLGFPEENFAWLKPLLGGWITVNEEGICLLYTSPSPRDATLSRMPSSA